MNTPDFAALVAAPHAVLLAWITDYFTAHPTHQIPAPHIITGRDIYGGDATAYAICLTAQGYTEVDRNDKPLAGTNKYELLEVEQLLEVCQCLLTYIPNPQ